MRKLLPIFLILAFAASVSAQTVDVNTTSEWDQGSFNSIRSGGDEIFLDSEIPSLDWSQSNFDEPVTEIVETSDYIYATSGQDAGGYIAKLDKTDGSIIWKVNRSSSSNEWNALAMGDSGYLYAVERKEGIYRLDQSGNFQPRGVYPIDDTDGSREFDVEFKSGSLFMTGGDGEIVKFNATDGTMNYEENVSTFAREIDFYNDTSLFFGGVYNFYRVDPSNGNVVASESGFSGSLDAIERGPNDYVWVGDNDGVYKYPFDLSSQICGKTNYNTEVPGMAADFSGVFTSTKDNDRFNKLEGSCNVVWEESPAPKGYMTLEADGRSLYAGAEIISGSEDGAVDKFFKEYDSTGRYESKVFSLGSTYYLKEARVKTSLNSQQANFTLNWSEAGGMAPPQTAKKEYNLTDGLNTLNLPADDLKSFEFYLDLESVTGSQTPRIEWVEIEYTSTVPGGPPVIQDHSPPDGSTVQFDPTLLEVNVTDPDGDNMNVTFREKGGSLIKKVEGVSPNSNASTSYSGFTDGNSYTWWVNVTDEFYDVSDSYSFTYDALDSSKIISKFETNYSSIMTSTSEDEIVPYTLRTKSGNRDVRISINDTESTVQAEFLDGGSEKNLVIDESGETVLIQVNATSSGRKDIVIDVEDLTIGVNKKDTLEIMARTTPAEFQTKSIPGIQLPQIFFLLIMSSVAYSVLL